jgi:hypothetical protein
MMERLLPAEKQLIGVKMLNEREIEILRKIHNIVRSDYYDYLKVAKDAYLIKVDTMDYFSLNNDLKTLIDDLIGMNAGEEGEFTYSQNEVLNLIKKLIKKNELSLNVIE